MAAAQRGETDIAGAAGAGYAVTGALLDLFELHPATCRCRSAERERGARGGVDLAAMVHLHDLDVPVGAQPARDFLDDAQQDVDPEAHIGRPHDRSLARRLAYPGALLLPETGRTDPHRRAEGCSELGLPGRRLG